MKPSLMRGLSPLLAVFLSFCAFAGEVARCPSVELAEAHDANTWRQFNEAAQKAPRLFRAILANDARAVQRYLAQGDDPNACALGASLLSQAVNQGRMDFAVRLIRAGASTERPLNAAGETVLLHTIGEAQWDRAMDLVAHGADVNAQAAAVTPLLAASAAPVKPQSTQARRQLDLVRLLLVRGAGVNTPAPDGSTPLLLAVRTGNAALIQTLLFFGADPLLRDRSGMHALQQVQEARRTDLASLLATYASAPTPAAVLIQTRRNDELASLLAQSDVNKVASLARQALLMAALVENNLPAVGLLARWGADPNGVMAMAEGSDPIAVTPLQLAVAYDMRPEVLEALIHAGADPNGTVAFDDNEPPLLMSLGRHNTAAARTLLRLGADPNRIGAAGDMSALMMAVSLASLPELDDPLGLIQQLLDGGADPNAVGPRGITALHVAAIDGNAGAARLLLQHGANPDIRDEQRKTALDYARKSNAAKVLAVLKTVTTAR